MSNSVTNVEIEDVLSSIRRLVSDGDKAKSRNPASFATSRAPRVTPSDAQTSASESMQDAFEPDEPFASNMDRLVLTPAFLVVDDDDETLANVAKVADVSRSDHDIADGDIPDGKATDQDTFARLSGGQDKVHNDQPVDDTQVGLPADGHPELTEMVREEVGENEGSSADPLKLDRSNLAATIAELEAAISAGDDDCEPDVSEAMAETIAWPVAAAQDMDQIEDVIAAATNIAPEQSVADADLNEPQNHQHTPDADASLTGVPEDMSDETDTYADDDIDGLLNAGGVTLDENAMRKLVADVVRQELSGNLGEKISRNVRKLVRREIYRILSSEEFD